MPRCLFVKRLLWLDQAECCNLYCQEVRLTIAWCLDAYKMWRGKDALLDVKGMLEGMLCGVGCKEPLEICSDFWWRGKEFLWAAIYIVVGEWLETSVFYLKWRGCFVVLAIKSFFENCPGGQEDGNFSEPSFKDVTIELTNFEDASGS